MTPTELKMAQHRLFTVGVKGFKALDQRLNIHLLTAALYMRALNLLALALN